MTNKDKQLLADCRWVLERYITFQGTPTADRILRITTELKNRIENAENAQK